MLRAPLSPFVSQSCLILAQLSVCVIPACSIQILIIIIIISLCFSVQCRQAQIDFLCFIHLLLLYLIIIVFCSLFTPNSSSYINKNNHGSIFTHTHSRNGTNSGWERIGDVMFFGFCSSPLCMKVSYVSLVDKLCYFCLIYSKNNCRGKKGN